MKGLMKNNYYKMRSGFKAFVIVLILTGLAVAAFDNETPSLLMGYIYFSIVGLSLNSAMALRKTVTGKWDKYILTMPVKRAEIIKSLFFNQMYVLVLGIVFSALTVGLSIMVHGFPLDKGVDIWVLFSSAIGVSCFMSGGFFSLSYLGKENWQETMLIFSLGAGIGSVMLIVTFLNKIFARPQTDRQILLGCGVILLLSLLAMLLSYFWTKELYSRKEI